MLKDLSFGKTINTRTLVLIGACAFLGACQAHNGANPNLDNSSKIDNALQKAAYSAASSGNSRQSLAYLEKIYKRNSSDANAATQYAQALREADFLPQADLVLTPFVQSSDADGLVYREYAALKLAQGDYADAQTYAQKAIAKDETDGQAYHYLGISLEAREMHKEAERAFRNALDHWKGDPTTIMNNLALNLASQSYFQEALEILHKAQALSPQKIEIERNIRIVTALQQSEGGYVPKPKVRPSKK